MKLVSYILFLLVALLGITFSSLNASAVPFNYYFGIKEIPLSLLLAMTLIIGLGITLIVTLLVYIRLKGENMRLQRRVKLLDKELTQLRALPLNDLS